MSKQQSETEQRRRVLRLLGGGAIALPIVGLSGCGGGEEPAATPAASQPEPAPVAAPQPAVEAEANVATEAAPMPKLSESDPQAQALAYVEDAADVDASTQPRYQPGQACLNCALYQGKESDAWAACSIFPGKLVAGAGWCSVYAPKPG